jgi:histidine triad (HIT) family protein
VNLVFLGFSENGTICQIRIGSIDPKALSVGRRTDLHPKSFCGDDLMASIFTQIVEGNLPCHKICENDSFLAFLDINPIKPGHSLVIPKKEVDYLFDLEDDLYRGLMAFAKPVAEAIRAAVSCQRVGVIVAGYEVPHAHVHLIPTESMADFSFALARRASDPDLAKVAESIRQQLPRVQS